MNLSIIVFVVLLFITVQLLPMLRELIVAARYERAWLPYNLAFAGSMTLLMATVVAGIWVLKEVGLIDYLDQIISN